MFAKVTPAAGRTVKHPRTRRTLRAKGERVELSTYWRRRAADGDVTVEDEDDKKEKTTPRAKPRATTEEV